MRKGDLKWKRPTRVDEAAIEAGLAMALTRRRSVTSAASPMRSSLRSSMRRQSLAIDAQAAAATASAARAAPARSKARRASVILSETQGKARRASVILSETISVTATAVKHLTLRALQSRHGQRVGPEPFVGSKRHHKLYKPVPLSGDSECTPIASIGASRWRDPP